MATLICTCNSAHMNTWSTLDAHFNYIFINKLVVVLVVVFVAKHSVQFIGDYLLHRMYSSVLLTACKNTKHNQIYAKLSYKLKPITYSTSYMRDSTGYCSCTWALWLRFQYFKTARATCVCRDSTAISLFIVCLLLSSLLLRHIFPRGLLW